MNYDGKFVLKLLEELESVGFVTDAFPGWGSTSLESPEKLFSDLRELGFMEKLSSGAVHPKGQTTLYWIGIADPATSECADLRDSILAWAEKNPLPFRGIDQ